MTPEEKELLERIANQVGENNEILRGIRNSQRRAAFFKIIYWTAIILLSFGAYYFVQPYVDMLKGVSSGNLDQLFNQSSGGIGNLLKEL